PFTNAAPQCGQNLLPTNAKPKHDGHEIVASFVPQCSHCTASDDTAAPHVGQWSVAGWTMGTDHNRKASSNSQQSLESRLECGSGVWVRLVNLRVARLGALWQDLAGRDGSGAK